MYCSVYIKYSSTKNIFCQMYLLIRYFNMIDLFIRKNIASRILVCPHLLLDLTLCMWIKPVCLSCQVLFSSYSGELFFESGRTFHCQVPCKVGSYEVEGKLHYGDKCSFLSNLKVICCETNNAICLHSYSLIFHLNG